MDGIEIWIGIGIGFSSLVVGLISIWLSTRKDKKKIDVLSKMLFVYQDEVELLKKSYPEQMSYQQQWLALQRQKQENEESWRKLTTVGNIIKFFAENSD
jgi:hypothetical protein